MPGVAAKDPFEVPLIDDEKMVEALGSDGPDEALRIRVGVRGPERVWDAKTQTVMQRCGIHESTRRVDLADVLVAVADRVLI